MLDLERCRFPANEGLRTFDDSARVIGVQHPSPIVRIISDFVILVAEEFPEHGIDVNLAGGEIPIPHADPAGRGCSSVTIVRMHRRGYPSSPKRGRDRAQPLARQ